MHMIQVQSIEYSYAAVRPSKVLQLTQHSTAITATAVLLISYCCRMYLRPEPVEHKYIPVLSFNINASYNSSSTMSCQSDLAWLHVDETIVWRESILTCDARTTTVVE